MNRRILSGQEHLVNQGNLEKQLDQQLVCEAESWRACILSVWHVADTLFS